MRTLAMAVVLTSLCCAVLAADVPVKVYVDGKLQAYRPPALLRGGTVYVPLRAGATSLGLDVKWDADTKTAQVCSDIGCTLHLFHGVDVGENANQSFIETKVAEAERKMQEKYVANMGDFDNYKIAIREGAPHVEVLKYAREAKADLIVMAHHTREVDPEQAVLGSTIEQVVLRSACPVLSVNHPDKVDVSPYGPGAKSEKAAA